MRLLEYFLPQMNADGHRYEIRKFIFIIFLSVFICVSIFK
jgi:hypothetical protein